MKNHILQTKTPIITDEMLSLGVQEYFRDKQVLITGGTGSFGNYILDYLLASGVKRIVVFSRDEAKQYAMQMNYRERQGLEFEIGDVRSFKIDKKFDAVISLFHVISYQLKNEDILAVFNTAAKHLKPNGVFIFDFWYGPGVLTDPPVVRLKRIENEEIEVLRIAEPVMHPNENVVDVNYCVQVKQKESGEVTELNEIHKMRYLFIPEILQFCNSLFTLKTNYAWMEVNTPNFTDWLCVSTLIKK